MSQGIKQFGRWTLALGLSMLAGQVYAQCSTAAWDSEVGAVQAVQGGGDAKYEQNCGLTVNAASPGYVTTSAPTDETEFYTRFYFYADAANLSNDAVLFTARDGSEVQVQIAVRQSGDDYRLITRYRSGGNLVTAGQQIPLLPVWQAVNVNWTTGNGSGSIAVKLDGVEKLSVTNLSNANERVNQMDLGIISPGNASVGTGLIALDAIDTRRALPEPALLTNNELRNISTRALVGLDRKVVPAGFIITGDTKKCVLIRGRGQSLPADLPSRVGNPTLTLSDLSTNPPTTVYFNDNWQTQSDPDAAQRIQDTGRAPTNPTDAAIFQCLEPGAYTATLEAANGSGLGTGIVEVLDVDLGTPYLRNISTRAEAIVGRDRIIAGFIIEGTEPRTVLIRGRGPSLPSAFNPRLSNPTIELLGEGGAVIDSNDDWQNQDVAKVQQIEGSGRAPGNAIESAIVAQLPPGPYTVRMQSTNGAAGIGIIEVLDIQGASVEAN
ncbi:MAG: hypothetical protein V2I57_13200 [Xanthomonadales bacterium]|jgi:hypothetical protein|nr:hypothetical protein [Xanthomonadales bacterium]